MGRIEDINSLESFLGIPRGGNRGVSPNFPQIDLVGEVLGTCRINVDTLEITRVEDDIDTIKNGTLVNLDTIDAIEFPKDGENS